MTLKTALHLEINKTRTNSKIKWHNPNHRFIITGFSLWGPQFLHVELVPPSFVMTGWIRVHQES